MRKYEIMYILRADLDEATRGEVMAKLAKIITDKGGSVEKTDESMGLRELAYPIKKQTKGHYYYHELSADAEVVNKISKEFLLDASILKFLFIAK